MNILSKKSIWIIILSVPVILTALAFVNFSIPKTYNVVLTASGFDPALLTLRKGDSVKFTTNLDKPFWPASDPHPTHTIYNAFDPKKGLRSTESWTFKFEKAGVWTYHDHLTPNARGQITVKETNPIQALAEGVSSIYKFKYQKHDYAFMKAQSDKCNKLQSNRNDYLTCWYTFFSDITKDFGVPETMRLVALAAHDGMTTYSDCHLFADQTGTDGYWNYVSKVKFDFTNDFGICDYGFFHGFMSEFMSHGQDFTSSRELCDSLKDKGDNMVKQCYIGMGNGLSFYYWSVYDKELLKITSNAIKKCSELTDRRRDCVFGVYSGMDHLFQGLHGSDIRIDIENPYVLCNAEKNPDYKNLCFERMIPSLFAGLKFDVAKIARWLYIIPPGEGKKESGERVGLMLSELEAYKANPDFRPIVEKCRKLTGTTESDCIWGIFYNVFMNLQDPGSKLSKFECKSLDFLTPSEAKSCAAAKTAVTGIK